MNRLSLSTLIELALIGWTLAGIVWLGPERTLSISLGWGLLGASLLLLVQGLFRDLWFLYEQRRVSSDEPPLKLKCMCLESTLGMAGVVAGGLGALFFQHLQVSVVPWVWPLAAMAVMLFGASTKDVIVMYRPLGVRREPNHRRIVVG